MRPSNECPSRGPAADEGIIWAPPPSLFQPRSSRLAVPFQPRQRAHSGSFPPSGVSRWGAQIEKVNSGGEKERESEGPPSTAGSAAGDHKVKKTWPHKPTYMSQVPLVPKKNRQTAATTILICPIFVSQHSSIIKMHTEFFIELVIIKGLETLSTFQKGRFLFQRKAGGVKEKNEKKKKKH